MMRDNLIGKTLLNRYRVDAFIGRGGMAEVYKVWDTRRAAYLAMKLLHEDLALDKLFLRRFKREAQTLSRLQHPNIVRLYGLEQADTLAFMLLDFVEGSTLRHEIFSLKGPVAAGRLREVMRPVCSALHFAHSQGFIHCDVKPANIMLHRNGTVLVTDFGIARMSDTATATMIGVGTPAYMAPEQVRGYDPLPQTDIYALGIVLYELLTGGERPFTGEAATVTGSTSEKVRWEQVHLAPPVLRLHHPGVSPALESVVMACLEKEPRRRYASALDLLNALEEVLGPAESSLPATSRPTSPPAIVSTPANLPGTPAASVRLRRAWAIGGTLTVALCAGLLVLLALALGVIFRGDATTPPLVVGALATEMLATEALVTEQVFNTPIPPTATSEPTLSPAIGLALASGAPNTLDGGDGLTTTGGGTLSPSDNGQGTLDSLFEAHNWVFEGQGGQVVTIRVDGVGNTDPRAKLLDPAGRVLAEDDDSGDGWNALITATLPTNGTYTIRVDVYTTGMYTISLGSTPAIEVADCDSRATRVDVNSSYDFQMHRATGGYPNNCLYYCLPVPDGRGSLTIDLRNFDVDLDLYVGYGSIETVQGEALEEGVTYYWKSNALGTNDERVTIGSPNGGLYYIEVCSYDGTPSPFQLQAALR